MDKYVYNESTYISVETGAISNTKGFALSSSESMKTRHKNVLIAHLFNY